MVSKPSLILFAFTAAFAWGTPLRAQSVAIPEAGGPLLHPLWERSPSEYIRQWEFSGPLNHSESTVVPKDWIQQRAWSDTTEVSDALNIPSARRDGTQLQTAYAQVSITRDADGPTNLLIGVDGEYEVLVGGSSVFRSSRSTTFSPDHDVVPVNLKKGDNKIVLRLINHGGPWRLALRAANTDTLAFR